MPCTVVVDIEGTTSATSYLTEQLYPYSAARFGRWVEEHPDDPQTARAVQEVRVAIGDPAAGIDQVVAKLTRWLAADAKVGALKAVQGRIWEHGFAAGELVSHFYPDAVRCLRAWWAAGHPIYVYSSGSVAAQRAWFGHSPDGDLLPLLSGHFDLDNAGPKRDPASYRAITARIGCAATGTVFLSDVTAELDAARQAGWHTVGVRRPGEPYYPQGVGDHLEVASFDELDLTGERPRLVRRQPGSAWSEPYLADT